jgi:hypothetical protein
MVLIPAGLGTKNGSAAEDQQQLTRQTDIKKEGRNVFSEDGPDRVDFFFCLHMPKRRSLYDVQEMENVQTEFF